VSQMVKNVMDACNIPLTDAVKMASLTPATVIGMDDKIGSLEVGKIADINILNSHIIPVKTMIDGKFIN